MTEAIRAKLRLLMQNLDVKFNIIKKAAAESTAALIFGGPPGSRTRHQRIMLTNYGFRHPFRVCGLDCLLSLRPARTVSTRSL